MGCDARTSLALGWLLRSQSWKKYLVGGSEGGRTAPVRSLELNRSSVSASGGGDAVAGTSRIAMNVPHATSACRRVADRMCFLVI